MTRAKGAALAIAACLIIAVGVFTLQVQGKTADYAEAQRLAEAGDTQNAYSLLNDLGDYADAKQLAADLVKADPALPYRSAQKGDLVTFGTWEQDGTSENGAEPVGWIVLDKVNGKLLLLSEACLDCRPYNPAEFQSTTWEQCELRSWLNSTFLENAFTADERPLISQSENINENRLGADDEDDPMHEIFVDGGTGTDQMGVGGANTTDYVFLLSETDTLIYLHDELARETVGKAKLVDAAAGSSVDVTEDGCVGWWLRSPGVYSFTAQFVTELGEPYPSGAYVELSYGVRPAIWLDVNEPSESNKAGA